MSLFNKLIKNDQVDCSADCLEIPLSPIKLENCRKKKSFSEMEAEQKDQKIKENLDEIVKQSKDQAESLIQQAEEQALLIKEQARDEGYQAGLQEGRQNGYQEGCAKAAQDAKEMKEKARGLLQSAHRESKKYVSKTQTEIIKLAAAMASKVIHLNIDTKDECIVEIVKNALRYSEEKRQILIRCSAKLVSILQTNSYQFEKICPNASFVFLEDPSIEDSGCMIETEDQVINLDVDKQLDNIVNALLTMEDK